MEIRRISKIQRPEPPGWFDGEKLRPHRRAGLQWIAVAISLACVAATTAGAVPFFSPNMGDYLLIGTGDAGDVGTSVAVSKFEIGANSEAVPMSGLSGPGLPGNAVPVFVGVGGNGDIAITDTDGNFDVSDLDIYGDTGIDCSGNNCNDGNSNSDFNGNNLTNSNGINQIVNLAGVTEEINAARNPTTGISSLLGNQTLTFSDGIWDSDLTILLAVGVTVFDFDTNGNDLKLEDANLLIDGPSGAYAIFRIPDEANFLVSNSNLVVGDAGIGMNNVLFYTDKPDDNQHINVNSSIVNGIAFWDLGDSGGEIHFDNVQGCTQAVADKVNVNNVRLNNCAAFSVVIPEPGTAVLLFFGLVGSGITRRHASKFKA